MVTRIDAHQIKYNINNISSNTVLDSTYDIVICSSTSTLTLPSASSYNDRTIIIINAGSNVVTINPAFSEPISGNSNLVINKPYGSVSLFSNGTSWFILSNNENGIVTGTGTGHTWNEWYSFGGGPGLTYITQLQDKHLLAVGYENNTVYNGTIQNDSSIVWDNGTVIGAGNCGAGCAKQLSNGWILVGGFRDGKIYTSKNGGTTFDNGVSLNTVTPAAISDIIQLQNGWVLATDSNTGKVYKSENFGAVWNSGTLVSPFSHNLQCITQLFNGWIITVENLNGHAFISKDDGATWNQLSSIDPTGGLIGITQLNNETILVTGWNSGNIYQSIDYGNSWQVITNIGAPGEAGLSSITQLANGQAVTVGFNNGAVYNSVNTYPINPAEGQLLFDTNLNKLFVYYNGIWVNTNNYYNLYVIAANILYNTITANSNIVLDNTTDRLVCTANLTITLPLVSTYLNRELIIKNKGNNIITVDAKESDLIDGNSSIIIDNPYGSITLFSDGVEWLLI